MEAPILFVTGGSRGIGAAIAKLGGKRGYDVAVNYLRDAEAAQAIVAAVRAAGRRAIAVQGDMAQEADVTRAFQAIDKELGRLTHLVYSSGIVGQAARVEAADPAMMRQVLDLNVFGALLCARAAVPRISTQHGGRGGGMVFISSAAATLGAPGEYVWYAASKGAIDSMTIGLARELVGDGIRVNAVTPGVIETEIHAPGRLERITPQLPMKRVGTPDEVAEAVLFLLSDASSYTSGANLRVTGTR